MCSELQASIQSWVLFLLLPLESVLFLGLEKVMCFYPHAVCVAVKDKPVSQRSFPETPDRQEWKTRHLSCSCAAGLQTSSTGSDWCPSLMEKISM